MSSSDDDDKMVTRVVRSIEEEIGSTGKVLELQFQKLMRDEGFTSVLDTVKKERRKVKDIISQFVEGLKLPKENEESSDPDEVLADVSRRLDTLELVMTEAGSNLQVMNQKVKEALAQAVESRKLH